MTPKVAALGLLWLATVVASFLAGHEVGQEEPCVTDRGPGSYVDFDRVNSGP